MTPSNLQGSPKRAATQVMYTPTRASKKSLTYGIRLTIALMPTLKGSLLDNRSSELAYHATVRMSL